MATAKKTPAKGETKEPKAPKTPKAAAGGLGPSAATANPPAGQPAEPKVATSTAPAEQADKAKWTSYEIVDGETKQFVAPDAKATDTPAETASAVHRLERARALIELAKGTGMNGELVAEGIQSFKDTDGRTMNVVVSGGALYKQEV